MQTSLTTTPELLAPAGGRAQLEAAVRFGADAVYFACDRFGLRQRASNFALDDAASTVLTVEYARGPATFKVVG